MYDGTKESQKKHCFLFCFFSVPSAFYFLFFCSDRCDCRGTFAFVTFDDEADAEEAMNALQDQELADTGIRLSIEWTKDNPKSRLSLLFLCSTLHALFPVPLIFFSLQIHAS